MSVVQIASPSPQVTVPSAGWNSYLQKKYFTSLLQQSRQQSTHTLTHARTHTQARAHTKKSMAVFVTESVCYFRAVVTLLHHHNSIKTEISVSDNL